MDRPELLPPGKTLYWDILIVGTTNQPLAPDAEPTIQFYKNGVLTADTATITLRSLGRYAVEADLAGAETGNIYMVEETVVVDSVTYLNKWEFTITGSTPGGDHEVTITAQATDLTLLSGAKFTIDQLNVDVSTLSNGTITVRLDGGTYTFVPHPISGYELPDPITVTIDGADDSILFAYTESDSSSVIDLSGIRRVKTKHMEIEVFDPITMQRARANEEPLPAFCDSHICIGVHKRC